ncbi:transcriptional regulator [Streptosporangium nondiastaticum]|uniref:Transcriptional regulator n=1 Tax=Streptosporangium nondiastaticum TaxID=35764 RepID=A0A9X7JU20_9ACTN|nr:helix-turn-helix transcriptional regulator [Streptosporangium nondiastaticum]PSJ29928.1 transcriptional regulator [Streptosporangium nondiastaticum]
MLRNSRPPIAWRYCGGQIKMWRAEAGVSREQLAAEANYDMETVKSMEQGRRRPTQRLLMVADQLCGAKGLLIAAEEYLQPERDLTREPEYLAAEAVAIAMHSFELVLIPGLLQTEEYVQALMSAHMPPLSEAEIEEGVAHRMRRQERLGEETVLFNFVIYEAALRTMVGGPAVVKGQLRRLLQTGEQRNVFIQVLPAGEGYFPGMEGAFRLLESPECEHFVFMEGHGTSSLDSESHRVSQMAKRFAMLRMQALSQEKSRRFIGELMEAL